MSSDTGAEQQAPGLGSESLAAALRMGLGELTGESTGQVVDPVTASVGLSMTGPLHRTGPVMDKPTELRNRIAREASPRARDLIARLVTAAGWPEVSPTGPSRPSFGFALRLADGTMVALGDGGITVIGREPGEATVIVARQEVSRRHVRFELRDGALSAADLGSSNGTRLRRGNDTYQLVPGTLVELCPGDRLDVLEGIDLCLIVATDRSER